MRFDVALERLTRLPDPLPPPRADIEARILTAGPLPDALRGMASVPAREAAALVLLYPDASGEACVVLTLRPGGRHVHAGQVALPGGKREPGDDFPAGTALREAAEEVGLDAAAAGVSLLGTLDPVDVRVSGFLLVPVLAAAAREPVLVPHDLEVAALMRVPVRCFLPDAPVEIVEEDREGWRLRYGAFPIGEHRVWGATGRILGQLGSLLGAGSTA
jgi:8-oxo-dGTP pyrophosphatase MutT (NUDIX family)